MKFDRVILVLMFVFAVLPLFADETATTSNAVKTAPVRKMPALREYPKDYTFVIPSAANRTDFMCDQYTVVEKRFSVMTFDPVTFNELENALFIDDSCEGFNRVMGACNYGVVMYFFRPIAVGYASIFPRFMVDGFANLTDNLEFLVRSFSCMLQNRWSDAGEEFLRFLTNTVFGVAGFFDVADKWFGLKKYDEDFGQAFASWGIGPGTYLVLPFAGPTSARDGVGLIFDYGLDPKTYVYGAQWFTKINGGSDSFIHDYEKITYSNKDSYTIIKNLWYVYRKWKINH